MASLGIEKVEVNDAVLLYGSTEKKGTPSRDTLFFIYCFRYKNIGSPSFWGTTAVPWIRGAA